MLGTISVKLVNVDIGGFIPHPAAPPEQVLTGATGTLTISFSPPSPSPPPPLSKNGQPDGRTPATPGASAVLRGLRYYLEVQGGTRISALRLGQQVTVSALDEERKPVTLATLLETIGTGDPALFSGPQGVPPP
jgi:hypothetical protein